MAKFIVLLLENFIRLIRLYQVFFEFDNFLLQSFDMGLMIPHLDLGACKRTLELLDHILHEQGTSLPQRILWPNFLVDFFLLLALVLFLLLFLNILQIKIELANLLIFNHHQEKLPDFVFGFDAGFQRRHTLFVAQTELKVML